MLKSYLTTLYNTILTSNTLTIIIIIIFFLTGLSLIIFGLFCFLDSTYRPNMPQYPFNIFMDRICPLIFIITPTILIYWLNPETLLSLKNLLYIIIIHSFIIVPIIYFWAKNRNWLLTHHDKYYFDSPLLFFHFAVGIIYPAFWGVFLSLNRFFNLTMTIDLQHYINLAVINTVLPFVIPLMFYVQFYKVILNFMKYSQQILWQSFCNICNICHLLLLKYTFYFNICEYLYKYSFIVGNFIVISSDIYPPDKNYSKWRYLLRYLYLKPNIIIYLIFFEFFIELIIFKGKLHYGLLLIFIFLIGRMLVKFSLLFFRTNFIDDVCIVDYLNKNWETPRYPSYFWYNFEEHSTLHQWSFNQEELTLIENLKEKNTIKFYKYRPTLLTRVQGLGYIYRIKAAYRTYTGVRWVHTGRSVHNVTPLFMRSFLERGSFLNLPQGWQKYHNIITYLDSKGFRTEPLPSNFYQNHKAPSTTSFQKLIEHNLLTNFVPLRNKNVIINNYDNTIILDSKGQECPDAAFDLKKSPFNDTRIIAMDQKSNPSEKGLANHILSNITEAAYTKGIRRYQSELFYRNSLHNIPLATEEIRQGLELLVKTCNKLEEHQLVWANYVKYFPNDFMPPLKVPSNFCVADLNDNLKVKIPQINAKIERISNYLYKKNIPELKKEYHGTYSLPEEALDLFQDSYLQKILSE